MTRIDPLAIAEILRTHCFKHQCEDDLQNAIASVLTNSGITFQREAPLGPRDRVDFLVEKIGIEVKIKGAPTAVARQLNRYVKSDLIESILLVTTKATLRVMPATLNGKLINVVYLNPLAAF